MLWWSPSEIITYRWHDKINWDLIRSVDVCLLLSDQICYWYRVKPFLSHLICVYKDKTSYVRECFSKSVLLGTLDNPLTAAPDCKPTDISEGDQKVFACLCETDYCNSYRGPAEPAPDLSQKKIERTTLRPAGKGEYCFYTISNMITS